MFTPLPQAYADTICAAAPPLSSQEGFLPLDEDAFTESAARQAHAKLQNLLGPDGLIADAVSWQTSFVYLEGWYLKRQAESAIERGQPEPFVSDFCTFLRKSAYVRH